MDIRDYCTNMIASASREPCIFANLLLKKFTIVYENPGGLAKPKLAPPFERLRPHWWKNGYQVSLA